MKQFCKYCGSKLEKNQKFCPNCGKEIEETTKQVNVSKNKKGPNVFIIIFIVILTLVAIASITIYFTKYTTNDLEITNSKGKSMGVFIEWQGDIVNNGKNIKENVNIVYTCYNKSREEMGKASTKIKYIRPGEKIHFTATGTVGSTGGLECEHKIFISHK